MTDDDLDPMTELLGDPQVMRYYPRPKSRAEAQAWIEWNRRNYSDHGYGLWIVQTHDGGFVGDCGLTWQPVGDERHLEIGYHVLPVQQGHGYATEAAQQCVEFAQGLGEPHLVAIIHLYNLASRRVAEKLGLRIWRRAEVRDAPVVVYRRSLTAPPGHS